MHKFTPADAVTVRIIVPGWVTTSELPVPNTTPEVLRHTLVPGDAAEPRTIVSLAQVSIPAGIISATGDTSRMEKLIMLSQP